MRELLADDDQGAGDADGERAARVVEQIALAKSRLRSPVAACAPEAPDGAWLGALWELVDAELARSQRV